MWQALLDFLKTIWPSLAGAAKLLVAGWVGRSLAQGNAAEDELERVDKAMRMAVVNSARSVDERLRDAKQRGLYRVSGQPADDK